MYRGDDEISTRPDWNAEAYGDYLKHEGLKNSAKSRELFLRCYLGEWDDEEDYAQDWYTSVGEGPEWLTEHVNWGSLAFWLFPDQRYFYDSSEGGIHVFVTSIS